VGVWRTESTLVGQGEETGPWGGDTGAAGRVQSFREGEGSWQGGQGAQQTVS
jgi:hypothetical protein